MKTRRDLRLIPAGKVLWIVIGVLSLLFVTIISFAAADQETAEQASTNEMIENPSGESAQLSLDGAIELARQKIKEDPTSLKDLVALGFLLIERGSYPEAEKIFDDVLVTNDHYHEALTGKGIVMARTGKGKEAEEYLQKALVLNPNPVRTYYELGLLYEKRGDFVQANIEYKKGIEKFKQGRK